MRLLGTLFGLAVVATLVSACKGDGGAGGEPATEVLAQSEEIAGEEDDLLTRRDSLLMRRKEIREKRAELVEQRRQLTATGADTSDVDREVDALLERENELVAEEAALNDKYEQILEQRRAMMAQLATVSVGGDDTAKVAVREQGVAGREKELARREDRLAQREAELAGRERALALREKEMCGTALPATIIETVDTKGSRYTKRDVDPLLQRARRHMSRKGILAADLPAPAQSLEKEATKAMADGDYGKARFAAAQLLATVDAINVDKSFIQAKITRLNGAIKSRSLDESTRAEVDALFRAATADYGDGNYTSANGKLNTIYAKI
jgi:hypothetical protein